jgi:hypothetical protein
MTPPPKRGYYIVLIKENVSSERIGTSRFASLAPESFYPTPVSNQQAVAPQQQEAPCS